MAVGQHANEEVIVPVRRASLRLSRFGAAWTPFAGLAALAVIALFVACQIPSVRRVDIANNGGVLTGFHDREQTPQFAYRWTDGDGTIRLPSVPSGNYRVNLGVVAPRPAGVASPTLDVLLDGKRVGQMPVGRDYQHLSFTVDVPMATIGTHTLELRSGVFTEQTAAPRSLGIIVTDVSAEPVRWPLIPPLFPTFALIAEALMLHRLLPRRWRARILFLVAVVTTVGIVLLLSLLHLPFAGPLDAAFPPVACLFGIAVAPEVAARRIAKPIQALFAVALLALCVVSAARFLRDLGPAYLAADFRIFYQAATAVWTHQPWNLYDLPGIAANPVLGWVYRQPPFAAMLLSPLSLLPLDAAVRAWRGISLICVAGALWLLARGFRLHAIGAPRGWGLVGLVALALIWLPLRNSIVIGQWDGLILLLLVVALVGLRDNRPPLVGGAIAIAGLIKVYPFYLALFLIWKREWRALGWLVASSLALAALSALAVGWETTTLYVRQVFPMIGGSTTYAENQSLLALFLRVFQIQEIHGARVTLLTAVSLVCVTAPLCWRLRDRPARTSLRYAGDFGLTVGAMLLAIPAAWRHYEVALLIPVGVLLATLASSSAPRFGWRLGAASAIALLAFGEDVILRGVLALPLGHHSYFDRTILISAPVLAQIGLALVLWVATQREFGEQRPAMAEASSHRVAAAADQRDDGEKGMEGEERGEGASAGTISVCGN